MAIVTGSIDIQAADGGIFRGYYSRPADASPVPGLLLVQEVFGVNSHIRSVCDDYAAQGFAVLSPDVFWRAERDVELGYDQQGIERGVALRDKTRPEQAVADLQSTVTSLRSLPACNGKVAAIGYCMGGNLVYRLAATGSIDAGISYYGARLMSILDLVGSIAVPMQFHYGDLDQGIPLSEVDAVRAAFAGRRPGAEIHVYANADHGFNCDQRRSHNPEAATLARQRSLQFLRDTL